MRNSGLMCLLLGFSILGMPVGAEENVAMKADTDATKAARHEAVVEVGEKSSEDANSTQPQILSGAESGNIFLKPEAVTVAKWDGGELTNVEVSSTLATKRPPNVRSLGPTQFAWLPRKQQVDVVKNLAWEKILLQQARKAGIDEKTPEVAKAVEQQEQNLLNRIYYEQKIMPRLNELTVDTAQTYYDQNKEKMFTRPAFTSVRDLHVSTYEMVTTAEGDTLSGLAKSISGDEGMSSGIRDAESPFYLRHTPDELKDETLSSPIKPGEVLFVPRGEAAVTSATALAKELRQQLVDGKDIDEVAADSSGADFQVTATETLRINPRIDFWDGIKSAAASMGETSVSQVIKTPAGLDILVLQDKETTDIVPFDKVKDQLVSHVTNDETQRRETVEKTRDETLKALWKKYDVKVGDSILERKSYRGSDPLSTGTVIADVGDFKYTLEAFLQDLRLTGKGWEQLTTQERQDVAHVAPSITNYIIAKDARAMGLDEGKDFKEAVKSIADSEIAAVYKKQIDDPQERIVTEDELRAYYSDHIDNYTSAAQVTISELSKRINMTLPAGKRAEQVDEAKKSLNEIRSRIKSGEDFARLARRESEAISTRSRGGMIGTVPEDFRGEPFRNQVRQLKVGDVSKPFLYGSEMMIVRLDDRIAPTVQPFEEVVQRVMRDYAATMPRTLTEGKRENALKKVEFKLLF